MSTTLAPPFVAEVPIIQKEAEHRSRTAVRYGFVDLLRGFALVVMIETHVMNAYLPLELRRGSEFFFWLTFINGLVAPTFLFASGFSLMLQGNVQWENWLRFRPPFWKHMRRLGFILLVGYYTHLQGFNLSRYLKHWNDGEMWRRTLQVDILQCIVVSLLVGHLLMFILRKKSLLPWGLALVGLGVAFTTPLVWSRDFMGKLPLSVALFLNPHGVSLFPLFPWICFVLAGSFTACFFLKSVDAQSIPKFMRIAACSGVLMIVAGLLLRNLNYTLPGYVNFYTTSPLYSMIRMGCVLLIMVVLYRLEVKERWIPRPVQLAGQESLLVYGVHLWVIFGFLRGKDLGPILGKQLGYLPCFLLSAAIIVAMLLLARYWHALKRKHPTRTRRGQAIVVLLMTAVFLLS
jgi:uncharacterized membrane protein